MASCSILDRVKSDLRRNNLVNKNLEAPLSKEREITRYVLNLTKLAKSKYKVDLGNMFNIRKTDSNLKLEANIAAFDAVERSQVYESTIAQNEAKQNTMSLDKNKVSEDIVETETVPKIQPTVIEPKGLPILEITC